jgi:hypothetical protein
MPKWRRFLVRRPPQIMKSVVDPDCEKSRDYGGSPPADPFLLDTTDAAAENVGPKL